MRYAVGRKQLGEQNKKFGIETNEKLSVHSQFTHIDTKQIFEILPRAVESWMLNAVRVFVVLRKTLIILLLTWSPAGAHYHYHSRFLWTWYCYMQLCSTYKIGFEIGYFRFFIIILSSKFDRISRHSHERTVSSASFAEC